MTQPIDRAFVEIEPDTRDFSRELNHDVEQAYDKVERQTALLAKKITTTFDAAGRKVERTFTSIAKDGKVTTTVLEKSFDAAGDKIERVFSAVSTEAVAAEELIATVAKVAADATGDSWERAGERIESAFREAQRVAAIESLRMRHNANQAADETTGRFTVLRTLFSAVTGAIGAMAKSIGGFIGDLAELPSGVIKLIAILGAIVALTGPIIALVGALADLVGLIGPLPAALGVLVAAILPLVFAFQGLGDAIKAVNDGDPKKIAEAMKNLAPAARSVVKEITGLNGVFERFRKNIQQSFFAPIVGDIGQTVRIILPSLQKGINGVADALGHIAENFLAFIQQTGVLKLLNQLFAGTADILNRLNVPLVNFLDTMLQLAVAGLPFIKRFAAAFGELLEKFGVFVSDSIKSGAFNDFVEQAIETTKKLLGLVGALGNLFGALFSNADDEGRDFIQTLTDMINDLADFFRSAEGQKVLQDFIDNIKVTVSVIKFLIAVFENSAVVVHAFIDTFKFAVKAIGQFFTAVGRLFAIIGEGIATGFGKVVDFFQKLPGRIMGFLSVLPGMIKDFFMFLLDSVLRQIGIGIGLIIVLFTEVPKRIIAAIQALPQLLSDMFHAAWQFATTVTQEGIARVISFVKSIPSRIGALVASVGAAVASFFTKIFDGGKSKAKNAFDAIVNFFKNLPSRLGSFVSDVGGKIAGVIKSMINHAINKINEGLAEVDKFVPGDLPRIPNLAKGAIVKAKPGGTIARLAEANQDEIVGPLKDVAKLFQGNDGTTITFGPGSVLVSFEGTVPTEQQAFQTGQAVGQGIITILARRDVRTNVRTR